MKTDAVSPTQYYLFLSHLSGDEAHALTKATVQTFLSHLSGDEE